MVKLAACINSVVGHFKIFYLAYDLVVLGEIFKVFKMIQFYFQINILQNYVVLAIIKYVTTENVCRCAFVFACVTVCVCAYVRVYVCAFVCVSVCKCVFVYI